MRLWSHVDSIVLGEAENIWKDVIADFQNGGLKKKYQGTHLDLTKTVVPRRELFSDGYLYATVQTSRGCPMDCNFCSVTAFNGNRYRQRPYEEVLAELESIPQRQIQYCLQICLCQSTSKIGKYEKIYHLFSMLAASFSV